MRFYPAPPDTGIVLRRVDLRRPVRFRLSAKNARLDAHRVILEQGGTRLCFVEHLLAALLGMGIDNVEVDVEGCWLPFFDGSALAYVKGILKAGIAQQDAARRPLRLRGALTLLGRGRILHMRPAERLGISYVFQHRGMRMARFSDVEAVFAEHIAPARTFAVGDYPDFDYPFRVRSRGAFSFPYPPRFADEMLRHKILDMIGDLALLGARPAAHIWAYRAGHRETHEALRVLTKEDKDGRL